MARRDKAWHGLARRGVAWLGEPGSGEAGQGMVNERKVHMEKVQQMASLSELQKQTHKVLARLVNGPVVIIRRNKPIAVLVSVESWNGTNARLERAEQRFTQREAEAIAAANLAELRNEPTISHEELKARIESESQ